MSEQPKVEKSANKKTPIFFIAGAIGLIAVLAFTGTIGEKADEHVVDALTSNNELQKQVTILQGQLNATATILQTHENVLIQHDQQINGLTNNTNIIAGWATEFSVNVDNRLTALEGE